MKTEYTKANNSLLNNIHQLVGKRLLEALQNPEVTPQELAQAIKWLKDNNVTADLEDSPVLAQLADKSNEIQELPFTVDDTDEEAEDAY